MFKLNKKYGGILLVAGTQIGAGMLALPLTTGIAGFSYALLTFLLCFLYMLTTLFLLLEANYYSKEQESNVISMAQKHLGKVGEIIAWLCFILLMYSALSAYISGASDIFKNIISKVAPNIETSEIQLSIFISVVFGAIVYYGARCIDSINRILMLGLGFSYIIMVITLLPKISYLNLTQNHIKYLPAAIPVVILSFTAHIILPSLRSYLDNDIEDLKQVLIIGSCIPMLVYLIWVLIIVGIIPYHGNLGMLALANSEHPIGLLPHAISKYTGSDVIGQNNNLFSFCALTTSMLGVLLSLQDFLADGFKIKDRTVGIRFALIVACTIPPLLLIFFCPGLFIEALSYGGVFIAILYGILPPLMVWKARYQNSLSSEYTLPGGKPALVVILLIAVVVILTQILLTHGYLPIN
ncbi:MAG: aromatic amino acid transport family protein [Pseudomonadota bacterium]|nr:aromatic amino acid transport family protein [Pseudomonadota bacterium]